MFPDFCWPGKYQLGWGGDFGGGWGGGFGGGWGGGFGGGLRGWVRECILPRICDDEPNPELRVDDGCRLPNFCDWVRECEAPRATSLLGWDLPRCERRIDYCNPEPERLVVDDVGIDDCVLDVRLGGWFDRCFDPCIDPNEGVF